MNEDKLDFFMVGGKEVVDGVTYRGQYDYVRDAYVVVAKTVVPVFTLNNDGSWMVERQRFGVSVGEFKSESQFHALLKAYRESPGNWDFHAEVSK